MKNEPSFVNLKCSETTRAAAKVAAALLGRTLFDYVDAIVLAQAKSDILLLTGANPDTVVAAAEHRKTP